MLRRKAAWNWSRRRRMGSLVMHMFFCFCKIVILGAIMYSMPIHNKNHKCMCIYEIVMRDLVIYGLNVRAYFKYSYFSYCLTTLILVLQIFDRTVVIYLNREHMTVFKMLYAVSQVMCILYNLYILVAYRETMYLYTFHEFGSNISLYKASQIREYYLTIVANITANVLLCITSIFVLLLGDGNLGGFGAAQLAVRLVVYALYIVFSLYKCDEENVACRRVAIFITLLQIAHSSQILFTALATNTFPEFIKTHGIGAFWYLFISLITAYYTYRDYMHFGSGLKTSRQDRNMYRKL